LYQLIFEQVFWHVCYYM